MKKTILLVVTIILIGGCGRNPTSPLQEHADRLGNFVIDADLTNVMRVMVCDTDGENIVNALYRYSYYGPPKSNENYRFEPGSLVYPLLLSVVELLDTETYLPAVYKRFNGYEINDTRFIRESAESLVDSTTTLRAALSITSNVGIITVLDNGFGHRRGELLERMKATFGSSVRLPETLESDSAWYEFLQGHGFLVNMETMMNCYRNLPSHIKDILPQVENGDGIVGIPSLVVQKPGRANAMFLGINNEGSIGLIIFEGSKTHPKILEQLLVSLLTNKLLKV